ncbi:hypothetical protein QUF75_15600 [Desulfococcaceae bacterium HSG7]|nr:hypothetical protein [Desulfococcaceae bacterium HSG7]
MCYILNEIKTSNGPESTRFETVLKSYTDQLYAFVLLGIALPIAIFQHFGYNNRLSG